MLVGIEQAGENRRDRRQEKNYTRLDKLEEDELIRKLFTVKCAFMYDIVKVEKYSYNKGEYVMLYPSNKGTQR